MTYEQWLTAFRAEGFWLNQEAQSLVMPAHSVTQRWHASNVSPATAAGIWFEDNQKETEQ